MDAKSLVPETEWAWIGGKMAACGSLMTGLLSSSSINSSPPGQNGCHSGRQQFQMHFLNENDRILIQIFTAVSYQESNWQ